MAKGIRWLKKNQGFLDMKHAIIVGRQTLKAFTQTAQHSALAAKLLHEVMAVAK
jgi:hypothetical protein